MGPQTLTPPFTVSATNFPHPLKDRGALLRENTCKKVNVPAQLFLILVAIFSTKGFLGVPENSFI